MAVYLYLDKELKIVHSNGGCPELRMAKKYNYWETLRVEGKEEARRVDQLYKPCPRCEREAEKERTRATTARRKSYGRKRSGRNDDEWR